MLLLAVGVFVLTAGSVGAAVGAATVARHQAQAAADLSALAGAARAADGAPAACARAGELAAANDARLTGCDLAGFDLTVTVAVDPAPLVGLDRPATATARAGPVRAGPVGAGRTRHIRARYGYRGWVYAVTREDRATTVPIRVTGFNTVLPRVYETAYSALTPVVPAGCS